MIYEGDQKSRSSARASVWMHTLPCTLFRRWASATECSTNTEGLTRYVGSCTYVPRAAGQKRDGTGEACRVLYHTHQQRNA